MECCKMRQSRPASPAMRAMRAIGERAESPSSEPCKVHACGMPSSRRRRALVRRDERESGARRASPAVRRRRDVRACSGDPEMHEMRVGGPRRGRFALPSSARSRYDAFARGRRGVVSDGVGWSAARSQGLSRANPVFKIDSHRSLANPRPSGIKRAPRGPQDQRGGNCVTTTTLSCRREARK